MTKTHFTIRLSEQSINELIHLESVDIARASQLQVTPKTRTEIIEEAIDNLYVQKTDQNMNDAYFMRLENIISGLLKRYFDSFLTAINANHVDVLEEKEYLKCIMKGFKFPETDQAAREFLYMPSVYTDLITRKVMEDAQKEIDEEQG